MSDPTDPRVLVGITAGFTAMLSRVFKKKRYYSYYRA